MRTIVYLVVICLITGSCSSANKATVQTDATPTDQPVDNTGRDGSSFEKAIIVKSIRQEYEWVRAHYPDSKMKMQRLVFDKKLPYDILTFEMPNGTDQDFYFDISKFYGKF